MTSRPSPPSSTDTTIPAPSADTVLQVAFPAEHRVERFLTDGRWVRVADDGTLVEQRPRSFYERGRATLSPDGLRRLAEALDAVDFFALPAEVPANLPATPTPVRLPNGQGPLAPRPIVITAPTPDGGGFHTVRGTGDPRLPETYGALAPLVRVLDREAWGGWMYE